MTVPGEEKVRLLDIGLAAVRLNRTAADRKNGIRGRGSEYLADISLPADHVCASCERSSHELLSRPIVAAAPPLPAAAPYLSAASRGFSPSFLEDRFRGKDLRLPIMGVNEPGGVAAWHAR